MCSNTMKQGIKSNGLGMRINSREIAFNRKVLKLLGDPMCLNFWWSEQKRVILVGIADEPTEKSVELPKATYTRCGSPYIRIQKLRRTILKVIGVDENMVIKMRGEYIPNLNMIAFKADITDLEVCKHE